MRHNPSTRLRFIPAGAGNTKYRLTLCRPAAVYPRWRGEHAWSEWSTIQSGGLSPLARGTLMSIQPVKEGRRFIPAGAGNTIYDRLAPGEELVYPRWRGEHARPTKICLSVPGLSPLARGTQLTTPCRRVGFRFIPAGAGNTPPPQILPRLYSVYPRWRGEHSCTATNLRLPRGLSPLARGTQCVSALTLT